MTPDHYATLGLAPTSEDVVIRAAYRALIRRYHPDGNASAAATARTRAINAAYEVLIDPEKRAEYDQVRAAEAWPSRAMRRSMPAPSRWFAAACVTVLLVLVFLVAWSPLSVMKTPERVTPVPARSPDVSSEIPVLPRVADPAAMSQATEAEVADPQLDEPLPEPPKVAVAARSKSIAAKPQAAALASPRPAVAETKPNVSCRTARTPGERAVCGNRNLADLDRQQTLFYGQSWLRADAAKRLTLQSTRDRFLSRRDSCRSVACTRAAYLARLREVSEIMVGPVKRPN